MPEKLKLVDRITNETGMKFGVVGLLIGLVGVTLAFVAFPVLGYRIGVMGALVFFTGMALHFVMNWREIFHIDRQ